MTKSRTPIAGGRRQPTPSAAAASFEESPKCAGDAASTADSSRRVWRRLADATRRRTSYLASTDKSPAASTDKSPAQSDGSRAPVAATTIHDEQAQDSQRSTDPTEVGSDDIETAQDTEDPQSPAPTQKNRRRAVARAVSFGALPFFILLLALGAAYLKYEHSTAALAERAGADAVQAAKDTTIAMLSYTPDTAEPKLTAARERLSGTFRDSYTSLTHDVVIPGAKQKQISAKATVPSAALVTATADHAVVLVFVDQTTNIGTDAPTDSASSIRVTLDKQNGHWLISQFDPI